MRTSAARPRTVISPSRSASSTEGVGSTYSGRTFSPNGPLVDTRNPGGHGVASHHGIVHLRVVERLARSAQPLTHFFHGVDHPLQYGHAHSIARREPGRAWTPRPGRPRQVDRGLIARGR